MIHCVANRQIFFKTFQVKPHIIFVLLLAVMHFKLASSLQEFRIISGQMFRVQKVL